MAELERDPQHGSAKRQQRVQAFTNNMQHASLERQLLASQAAKAELDIKLREKELQIERLERDKRWLYQRETEERETREKEGAEREEERRQSDAEIRSLRASLSALRDTHVELQEAHSTLSRTHSQEVSSAKTRLVTLEHQTRTLEDELADYRRLADERGDALREAQQRAEDLEIAVQSSRREEADSASWPMIRDELHRQAEYMRTLENTNARQAAELARLKEKHASIEVLREEKLTLERRLAGMEEMRGRVVGLEAQLDAARREREEWVKKGNVGPRASDTSISVTQTLSALRLEHARLLEEHGATVAHLRSREAELVGAEQRTSGLQDHASTLETETRALKDKVAAREHRAELAEREIGFLQALLASYTAEEGTKDDSGGVDEVLAQRVHQLESASAELKAANVVLQNALERAEEENMLGGARRTRPELLEELERERDAAEASRLELEEARNAAQSHLDNIETLEQTLFELRGKIGTGSHVPPGIRVLSLRDNPAQQWTDLRQEAMDRLKHENEALIKRLKQLGDAGARVDTTEGESNADGSHAPREDLVPRESWEVLDREKKELEELVKQKEKRLLRLQQVFASKSAEFREAIASILGLKLAFYPNGQVRVTSIYDLEAAFVFQPAGKSAEGGVEGARMQLVAQSEGGPQDLPQMMRYWVEEEQCIPGFLASVTLECYDKSKREEAL
ncbi:hypothetical protein CONPUDRAFT_84016 [Coniophora puteana RWD-64-598 SS2]|uniref:Spindle assembly checkpoint component MAD1 n=1 Tax=Coniophora puteana (strain RWD-64-598) TaxID=741705 RepID=A0A5M3MFC1_CONPW|nr:uncharacterized protein CONPUDRAFT_84016 [Coniophora puteana RWD-64-598 SS2]EIW77484.1 hypothetical protein CONPUDRAFT_84016 [Coniophora puteana RWD-64-598 SS2]